MKVKVVGQAMVITSELSVEDIITLAKYESKALRLFEDKDETFRVAYSDGPGGANKYGIIFNTTDADGKAQLTINFGGVKTEERAAYVKDVYGMSLYQLGRIEAQAAEALGTVAAKLGTVTANLVVE